MFLNNDQEWEKVLLNGLEEDDIYFDYTSAPLLGRNKNLNANIIAKENGLWVGDGAFRAAQKIAAQNGYKLNFKSKVRDGQKLKKNQIVAHLQGNAGLLLSYERTLLNLISFTSGIASLTNKFILCFKEIKIKNPPRITATRKTLPFYKKLSLYSVVMGGGYIHRAALSSGILIKENHIHIYGGIKNAVNELKKKSPHLLKIEVEVRNFKELKEAALTDVNVIMLDNFSPDEVKSAIQYLNKEKINKLIEVSGGINLSTLKNYIIEGVDIISIGGLTHSVKAFDFSLLYLK